MSLKSNSSQSSHTNNKNELFVNNNAHKEDSVNNNNVKVLNKTDDSLVNNVTTVDQQASDSADNSSCLPDNKRTTILSEKSRQIVSYRKNERVFVLDGGMGHQLKAMGIKIEGRVGSMERFLGVAMANSRAPELVYVLPHVCSCYIPYLF